MEFLVAILPSLGVLFLFYLGVKALVEADRRERASQARWESRNDGEPPADHPTGER